MNGFRIAGLAAMLAAMLAVAAPGASSGPTGDDKGAFHADCTFSHRAHDDPIVFPGQPGASHSHDFFGGRTDASSTNQSLRLGTTSCVRDDEVFKYQRRPEPRADRSGYWVPALLHNGEPVDPLGAAAYYATGRRPLAFQTFPDDYKVIAGSAAGGPTWINGHRVYLLRRLEDRVERAIFFPDCWNGRDSDSANHKSHTAYSSQDAEGVWRCPPDYPVQVSPLRLVLRYPPLDGELSLASGDLSTEHADFMNGWNPDELAHLVEVCLNADEYCGGTDGPVPDH